MTEFPKLPLSVVTFALPLLSLMVNLSQGIRREQAVLLGVKRELGNPPSLRHWNNSRSSSPCDWLEILCADGVVTGISLVKKTVIGRIPPAICDLQNLTKLNLSSNHIAGGFPGFLLCRCLKLETLDLSWNSFVGEIPGEIRRLRRLSRLDLSTNRFSGAIPAAIRRLKRLIFLALNSNSFNGSFPPGLGILSNLEYLALSDNAGLVRSRIPETYGRLRKLKFLYMWRCNLIGGIPLSFSNLSSIQELDLSSNVLSGTVPEGLLQLKNLSKFYLWQNNLSGVIPSAVGALNLIELDLSENKLTGTLPGDFGNLHRLEVLNIYTNCLSGEIPSSIGLLPSLRDIKLFNNELSGVLPPELGLHSDLRNLEISNNKFSGQLPKTLCAGGVLWKLSVFSNNLIGEIPPTLGNCSTLGSLILFNNRFSGEVPLGVWTISTLSKLILSNNLFSGEIPQSVSRDLSILEISHNRFSGRIPVEISTWESLVVFKASHNFLSGEIPPELTCLRQLATLELDGNQFTGKFPPKITQWKSLIALNLSGNKLSGQVPEALGALQSLLYLDLFQNQFSGELPPSITSSRFNFLNLSCNQLSGKVPSGFQNFAYENSFLNNSNLCANDALLNLPNCHSTNPRKRPSKFFSQHLVLILILTVYAPLAILIFILFASWSHRKKEHRVRDAPVDWKVIAFQRLNFTETMILSGLTEDNLIGSGCSGQVYRVVINQFAAEIETLAMIRHSNIVKLLCCISSEKSKLLVYEYMENQSLDQWLRGENSMRAGRILEWPTRLQIAIGAARGLCYMHNSCSSPIIHQDIKSSNILLDSDFKPKIADFGLAMLLGGQRESYTMSSIAGSFGYMPPEYAYATKVNKNVDVYSFGVVLLELTTGRGPIDEDGLVNLAEWANQHYSMGNPITDALDDNIKEPAYLEGMTIVFKLGICCTNILPSCRPSMEDVLQILLKYCSLNDKSSIITTGTKDELSLTAVDDLQK